MQIFIWGNACFNIKFKFLVKWSFSELKNENLCECHDKNFEIIKTINK